MIHIMISYLVLIEEDGQLLYTDAEISFIELIWSIPTNRTKFTTLLYQRMEEAQTKKQFPESKLKKNTDHLIVQMMTKSL